MELFWTFCAFLATLGVICYGLFGLLQEKYIVNLVDAHLANLCAETEEEEETEETSTLRPSSSPCPCASECQAAIREIVNEYKRKARRTSVSSDSSEESESSKSSKSSKPSVEEKKETPCTTFEEWKKLEEDIRNMAIHPILPDRSFHVKHFRCLFKGEDRLFCFSEGKKAEFIVDRKERSCLLLYNEETSEQMRFSELVELVKLLRDLWGVRTLLISDELNNQPPS